MRVGSWTQIEHECPRRSSSLGDHEDRVVAAAAAPERGDQPGDVQPLPRRVVGRGRQQGRGRPGEVRPHVFVRQRRTGGAPTVLERQPLRDGRGQALRARPERREDRAAGMVAQRPARAGRQPPVVPAHVAHVGDVAAQPRHDPPRDRARVRRLDVSDRVRQATILVEVAAHELREGVVVRVQHGRRRARMPCAIPAPWRRARRPGPRRTRRRGTAPPPSMLATPRS